jgi:O-acetyl-ADP-ribose deacetylase (regulator of RNase III)
MSSHYSVDETKGPQKPAENNLDPNGISSSPSSPPAKPDARSVSWENIPTWQQHSWSRVSREVVTRLPTPPPTNSETLPHVVADSSSDSDESDDSEPDEDLEDPLATPSVARKVPKARFPVNVDLNNRISLWLGDPTILNTDAVVNPTPITSSDKRGLGARILEVGGPALEKLLRSLDRPKTGEVRATAGFGLVTSTILHTLGPRYSDQYLTAAENALHNCYRSAFDYCVENHIETIAIPPIHSLHRSFPTLLGTHIAIRTLRCLMELRPHALQRIVLVFDPNDLENPDIYFAVMKLYFPRNEQELQHAITQLPEFKGNQFGETIVEERQVRIHAGFMPSSNPSQSNHYSSTSNYASATHASSSSSNGAEATSFSSSHIDDDSVFNKGSDTFPTSMRSMSAYKDEERRKMGSSSASNKIGGANFETAYSQYLALANTTDLSKVTQLGLFYQSGNDHAGRPIIVIVGCRIPSDHSLHDLVFLYYIKFMDTYANAPYVLLYIHTKVSSKKKPDISWFKKVYNVMDAKYGQSLVALHVLHPTFWLKVVEKLVSVFISSDAVLNKITYYDKLADLCTQLRMVPRLPNDILQADAAENGPLPANLTQ